MPIKVNVSLSAGGQLKPVSSRTLDGAHITIGRDKECSLSLEDTQKHVSRVHAKLDEEAGTYLMTVVSKVNPVMVNGNRHMYEDRVALSDGDVLTIGLYKLEVLIVPVPTRTEPPPPPPRPVAPPPAAFADDMTYIPPAPAEAAAPARPAIPEDFSEDMTYMPPARSRGPAAVPPPTRGLPISTDADADATYIPPTPAERPPDDEITFVRPASEMTNPLGRASKTVAPPPVEEDFSEDVTYVRRPAAQAPAPTPLSAATPAEELDIELDFELPEGADLSEEATLYHPAAADASVEVPDIDLSEEPTQVRPAAIPPAPPPPPRAAAAGPVGESGTERLLEAFMDGAGLRHLEIDDPEAFLRDSGAMVRTAIEGVLMLLIASNAVKKSLGVDAVDASDTNPFKTLSDPGKVIAFLFDPAKRVADGPDPVQALSDACSDLRVHQIALMAALQAAVLTALQRVDPKAVEREHGSRLGGLSLTRKPKLWDLSVAHHEKVTLEIGESINRVFGPEVQAAYVAEVRRIRGAR